MKIYSVGRRLNFRTAILSPDLSGIFGTHGNPIVITLIHVIIRGPKLVRGPAVGPPWSSSMVGNLRIQSWMRVFILILRVHMTWKNLYHKTEFILCVRKNENIFKSLSAPFVTERGENHVR